MKEEKFPTFEEFKQQRVNEKSEDQSYSYGCIMGYFNTGFNDPAIDENDLYNNEQNEYGLEIEPHVTVLYGLLDDEIDEQEIIDLLKMINGPIVSTTQISLFTNDKFDVVKWDIDSNELTILNKIFSKTYPFKSDFPDYHAHSTIAYCLPGTGSKYESVLDEPITKQIDYWVYSKANGKKIKIVPGADDIEILREATKQSIMTETELISFSKK